MDTAFAKKIAIQTVKKAGSVIMDNFHKVTQASYKGQSDIVTDVDLASEKIILDAINENFPDHSILSEEHGFIGHGKKYLWITDPIDGTINYYHGASPFRVGLCLLEGQKPILTVIYNPVRDQVFFAEKGKGASLNDKKLTTNSNADLQKSVIMTHLSSKKEPRTRTILALENIFTQSMHMRVFGSGLAAMTYVAEGKFDVFFNVRTNPWDILPGALLIEEAGGTVTDIKGNAVTHETTSVLATNGHVHERMLELLRAI